MATDGRCSGIVARDRFQNTSDYEGDDSELFNYGFGDVDDDDDGSENVYGLGDDDDAVRMVFWNCRAGQIPEHLGL